MVLATLWKLPRRYIHRRLSVRLFVCLLATSHKTTDRISTQHFYETVSLDKQDYKIPLNFGGNPQLDQETGMILQHCKIGHCLTIRLMSLEILVGSSWIGKFTVDLHGNLIGTIFGQGILEAIRNRTGPGPVRLGGGLRFPRTLSVMPPIEYCGSSASGYSEKQLDIKS